MIKDAARVFYRSKLLIGIALLTLPFCGCYAFRYYGRTGIGMIPAQLQQALSLSLYLFIITMFLSYEYHKKLKATGIAEAAAATPEGKNGQPFWSAGIVLSIWICMVTLFLILCVICCYSFYHIKDPNGEYIKHIIWNMLLNIFLIMELGLLIGSFLSRFRNRFVPYFTMILAAYLVSPYSEELAGQISQSTDGKSPVYRFVELFNIMPLVYTKFAPNYSFGESLLPYRVALILFWCAAVLTGIFLSVPRTRKWGKLSALLSCVCLLVYLVPSSKVIMNGNPANTLAHDQYYYSIQNAKLRDEEGGYHIRSYRMELSVGLRLTADVLMEVDESLPEYKMTLYHGYKVKSVSDGNNHPLKVSQEGDYITVKNTENLNIQKIRLVYSGCSPAYYSNIQGIFLPGYFAYYPRTGFVPLFDRETYDFKECFVNPNTEFAVKVNTDQTLYTNLEKNGKWYHGKSDGVTILSGFYCRKVLSNGNSIVYPYLYGVNIYDGQVMGEKGLTKYYEMMENRLTDLGRKNTIVFCVPNVKQVVNQHDGKNQIITRSIAI